MTAASFYLLRILATFLTVLLLSLLAVARVSAQTVPPPTMGVDNKILLKVTLATNQREFHIGETIPLQLSFSSAVKDRYQLNMAQYDRGGRMNYERFIVSPAEGAVDPLPTNTGSMGGLTNFQFLTPEPWNLKLNLNEWLRFTQPGEYRLRIVSDRITIRDPSNQLGTSPVAARSNEITLKIVAADPAWQKQVFRDAVTNLDKLAPTKPEQMQQYEATRRQSIETLRFLGTADAARGEGRGPGPPLLAGPPGGRTPPAAGVRNGPRGGEVHDLRTVRPPYRHEFAAGGSNLR